MGNKKKKTAPVMSKVDVRKRLSVLIANHPGESYNYKQLAMRLQLRSMDMKRLISEVLREMAANGKLDEISTGRYRLKQFGELILPEK
ncbi:MAG: hypothetical protein V8S95_06135 [Odoribacter sp.]